MLNSHDAEVFNNHLLGTFTCDSRHKPSSITRKVADTSVCFTGQRRIEGGGDVESMLLAFLGFLNPGSLYNDQ